MIDVYFRIESKYLKVLCLLENYDEQEDFVNWISVKMSKSHPILCPIPILGWERLGLNLKSKSPRVQDPLSNPKQDFDIAVARHGLLWNEEK